jgi:hypothetical protein
MRRLNLIDFCISLALIFAAPILIAFLIAG